MSRTLLAGLLVAVLGLAASAIADARTRPAKTKVTLSAGNDGGLGYARGTVSSSRKGCHSGRGIRIYSRRGAARAPAKDRKLGGDRAKLDGRLSRYSVDFDLSAELDRAGEAGVKIYAWAPPTARCAGAFSAVAIVK